MENDSSEDLPFIGDRSAQRHQSGRHTFHAKGDTLRLQKSHNKPLRQALTIGISFVSSLMLLVLLVLLWNHLRPSPTRRLPVLHGGTDPKTGQPASWFNSDCGNTIAEAKSRNCRFDIVLHAWLPQDCMTEDGIEDEIAMYANRHWHWGLENKTERSLGAVHSGQFIFVWARYE